MTTNHRFLITGLPRTRSAWLAALFSGDGVECWHDAVHHESVDGLLYKITTSASPIVGLVDPCAACIYPRAALQIFTGFPIVIVRRSESASLDGLTKWSGASPSDWAGLLRNHAWFVDHALTLPGVQWVKFTDLDDYGVVSELYSQCVRGKMLDRHRFDLFNTLRIEQHHDKAAIAGSRFRQ
jgi:hypothetical protein